MGKPNGREGGGNEKQYHKKREHVVCEKKS